MLKIRVKPEIAAERFSHCKACKFFQADTGTCGPPRRSILGKELTVEQAKEEGLLVTHYRKKYRLCGCKMKSKVEYHIASCPLGKWDRVALSDRQIEQAKVLIARIRSTGKAGHMEVSELFGFKSQMTGIRYQAQTCPACVRELIDDLEHALKGE